MTLHEYMRRAYYASGMDPKRTRRAIIAEARRNPHLTAELIAALGSRGVPPADVVRMIATGIDARA